MNKTVLSAVFTFFVLVFSASGCVTGELAELMRGMDEAQKRANERAREEVPSFMPLETMFPDPQVRALAKAAGKGRLRKIEELVQKGVDVNSRGKGNTTPLFWALRKGNVRGFKKLLELGADPNVIFDSGGSVMYWAVQHEDEVFLRAALQYGGDPNLRTGPMGGTLLHAATGYDTKRKVDLLLDAGADIDARDDYGSTPIVRAAMLNQYDLVYKLLNLGADYRIRNNGGSDVVSCIVSSGKRMDPKNELTKWMHEVVAWLKERGVEIPGY